MSLTPPNSHGSAYGAGYPLALAGATAATRYVGGTDAGAPASGAFEVGDFVISQDGTVFVCTVAGSPGTWTPIGGSLPDPITSPVTIAPVANDVVALKITPGPIDQTDSYGILLDATNGPSTVLVLTDDGTPDGTILAKIDGTGGIRGTTVVGDSIGSNGTFGANSDGSFTVTTPLGAPLIQSLDGTDIGFFGATPVGRPVVPLTLPAVQDVIDALVLLGLVSQSD